MSQYFAAIKQNEFFLNETEAHHACVVARQKEGDEILVFDGTGKQFKARIDRIQKKFVRGTLLSACSVRLVPLSLTLAFVPNSRSGLEDVLDKGTQLGVHTFLPLVSERSEYDVIAKYPSKKERWEQIMLAACKQCDTPLLPTLLPPRPFNQAVEDTLPSLLAYEAENAHTLTWGMEQLHHPKQLRVYVGPAGGWTQTEVSCAQAKQIRSITLGCNILRAETACIAVAAKLL